MIEFEDEDNSGRSPSVLDSQTGRPRLCEQMCDTCIFRPGNPMRLRPGRVKQMVTDSLGSGGFITCHSTLYGMKNPSRQQEAICRGFFDGYADQSNVLRVWGRLGKFQEINPNP